MIKEEIKLAELSKEKIMRQGNISMILDGYNDLFSDFDPRPNSQRGLSEDFLDECRKAAAAHNQEPTTELRLLVPKSKRNITEEVIIKKRLKQYFFKHFQESKHDVNSVKKKGAILIFFGFILMFISYLTYSDFILNTDFAKNIVLIITEPGGWFLFWIGGEKFVYRLNEYKPNYDFYKKMAGMKVSFHSY